MSGTMDAQRATQIKKYATIQITTASSIKTVCFIHEQCAFLLREASTANHERWRSIFNKVQNLLSLLQRSLTLSDPTSKSMLLLYDYCYCQLEDTTDEHLTNALRIIDTFRETFNKLQYR